MTNIFEEPERLKDYRIPSDFYKDSYVFKSFGIQFLRDFTPSGSIRLEKKERIKVLLNYLYSNGGSPLNFNDIASNNILSNKELVEMSEILRYIVTVDYKEIFYKYPTLEPNPGSLYNKIIVIIASFAYFNLIEFEDMVKPVGINEKISRSKKRTIISIKNNLFAYLLLDMCNKFNFIQKRLTSNQGDHDESISITKYTFEPEMKTSYISLELIFAEFFKYTLNFGFSSKKYINFLGFKEIWTGVDCYNVAKFTYHYLKDYEDAI